ncbi:antifreeze protein [Oceaniglobus roseus]|uniref:antifreeze protein n=1 Tax=Oceaniglobus roseus TaxID=1737570 RepID=UPI001FE64E32|nr:antifreeze protein [Kandeliimicrobium roseum]
MPRNARCANLFSAWFNTARMLSEAQTVIAYRMLGMAGLWAVAPSENHRMLAEKAPALMASSFAATQAMMAGKRPDQILDAAVRPLGQKTRANARRLSLRGPTHR